ncbi:MAG: oligosaccharide flippase family protein [Ignavibacteriaceae bacterium]|nr:oligosaccharide flippase family protein [Ignavibacteriaceae bacterium]
MKSFIIKIFPFAKKILLESQYVFYINLLEKIVFFVFFLILARELDKTNYGLIATVFAFTGILNSVFDLGFAYYFQREAVVPDIKQKLETAISFRIMLMVVFVIVMFVYLYLNLSIDPIIIGIVGLLTYLSGFNFILNSVLYGKKRYKKSFKGFFFSRVIFGVLIVTFYLLKVQHYLILLSLLIAVIFHLGILYKYLKEEKLSLHLHFDIAVLKKILFSSVPIGMGVIFVLIYDRMDVLIIERAISFEAVAIYSIAYSLYKIPTIICNVILTPVYTDLSKSFSLSEKVELHEILLVSLLLMVIAVSAIIFVSLFGEKIILFFYSNKYALSIPYLKYLVFALPGLFLNNLTGVISNSIRKEKIPMISTGLGAIIHVSINIILIRIYGLWGAVIATIISEYLVFLIQLALLVKHNFRYRFLTN